MVKRVQDLQSLVFSLSPSSLAHIQSLKYPIMLSNPLFPLVVKMCIVTY